MEEKTEQPFKLFKMLGILYAVLFLLEEWAVTQMVASDCFYNEVLGSSLAIGSWHIYPPWDYIRWCHTDAIAASIPRILDSYSKYRFIVLMIGAAAAYFLSKSFKVNTSHGSASFATAEDINKSDLGEYESKNGGCYSYEKRAVTLFGHTLFHWKRKIPKESGVVVGINPFTHKLMLHDGVEHMLLMAPTRSGKGVCTIVPTGLIWKHSIFFFDPKGEVWSLTSGFRKKYMHQKVAKFQPLCTDGSGARWNPLAEINYRTFEELSDVTTIVSVMVRPDGEQKGGDSFWPDSAAALLNGVILHLLYMYDREKRPLPCPTDIMSFLSSPDKTTDQLFTSMKEYPHISVDEFLETPYRDENGNEIKDPRTGLVKRHKNPLKEIYGEYIKDFKPFSDALGVTVRSIDEIRTAIQWKLDHMPKNPKEKEKIKWTAKEKGMPTGQPYYMLLVHPKVAECAANMLNGAEQTRASIMQTAQTALAVYQDPVVQENTAVSDFAIRDLLDPKFEFSLYLVMEVKDVQTIKPIARLFIQMLCSKLIRDMKFDTDPKAKKRKKQRLLLMLDEFPQLGNMKCIELALAICAGYGIKMCIVCQDVNQLNKAYTKDNSIGSNCHVHIYFTPNIDSGGATAEAISKTLGKKTIETTSHSSGKSLFDGSNSTSSTGRELMTPDEVSHMSSEKELVFVAGHKAIYGDKLRYYQFPWLLHRTQVGCPKTSDSATHVRSYEELFALHAADAKDKEETRISVLEEKAEKEHMTYADLVKKEEEARKAHEQTIIAELEKKQQPEKADAPAHPEGAEAPADGEHSADDARTEDPQAVTEPKPADINQAYATSAQIKEERMRRMAYRSNAVHEMQDGSVIKEEHELPSDGKPSKELLAYLNLPASGSGDTEDEDDDVTADEEDGLTDENE